MPRYQKSSLAWAKGHYAIRYGIWRLRDMVKGRIVPPVFEEASKTGSGQLRIGFLVCEPKKWVMQSVFDALVAHPNFSPGFLVTLSDIGLRLSAQYRAERFENDAAFFASAGPIWEKLYDPRTKKLIDPSSVSCDVLFIQQPWGGQQ
jgi:hypothetical protein